MKKWSKYLHRIRNIKHITFLELFSFLSTQILEFGDAFKVLGESSNYVLWNSVTLNFKSIKLHEFRVAKLTVKFSFINFREFNIVNKYLCKGGRYFY